MVLVDGLVQRQNISWVVHLKVIHSLAIHVSEDKLRLLLLLLLLLMMMMMMIMMGGCDVDGNWGHPTTAD